MFAWIAIFIIKCIDYLILLQPMAIKSEGIASSNSRVLSLGLNLVPNKDNDKLVMRTTTALNN